MFREISDSKTTAISLILLAVALLVVSIHSRTLDPIDLPTGDLPEEDAPQMQLNTTETVISMTSKSVAWTQGDNPFYTDYFKPAKKPTPAAPKDKVIKFLFQGFFKTSSGLPKAFISKDGETFTSPIGAPIGDGFHLSQITSASATATNAHDEVLLLPFRQAVELVIPAEK